MGKKARCPGCGAKNDATSYRCRICTAVINADASGREVVEDEPTPTGTATLLADHFDPDEINRQVQPSRARFGGESGGLAARIAAANGGQIPDRPAGPAAPSPMAATSTLPLPTVAQPVDLDAPLMAAPPSTAAPIEYDEEPFDPNAIFRDPA